MDNRVEIYIGFKCNNNCVFCVEKNNRERYQQKSYYQNQSEIEDKILELKKQGYNHINFLGGEPFLEKNFLPFLHSAKHNNFSVAVTTNGSLLADEEVAKTHLPLINDLIISIHGHTQDLVARQSNNPRLFEALKIAFLNIKKYFKGRLLKSNCVINKFNYQSLPEIVEFISRNGIKEVSLTNMSLKGFNNDYSVRLNDLRPILLEVVNKAVQENIILRFSDIPFCVLGDSYYLANELFADSRRKVNMQDQDEDFWRPKKKTEKCGQCKLKDLCLGVDLEYYKLFGDGELNPKV